MISTKLRSDMWILRPWETHWRSHSRGGGGCYENMFITTILLCRSRDCQLRAVCEFYREQEGEAGSTGGLVRMVVDALMGEAEAGAVETVTRDWARAATRGQMGGKCDQLCRDQE